MSKKIKIGNKNYEIKVGQYVNNDRLYLALYDNYGWCEDITINLSNVPELTERQIFLNNDLSEKQKEALFNDGVIVETMAYAPSNMSNYCVCFAEYDKLLEYDKEGTEKYLKNRGIELDKKDDNALNQDTEMER